MLINYFLRLAIVDRAKLVKASGVFLMRKTEGIFSYQLYELFGYYIEIKMNLKENKLESVKSFHDTDKLSFYLDDIDLH